jgi:hypothetical protein
MKDFWTAVTYQEIVFVVASPRLTVSPRRWLPIGSTCRSPSPSIFSISLPSKASGFVPEEHLSSPGFSRFGNRPKSLCVPP